MLLHRLPLDQSALCSFAPNTTVHEVELLKRLSLRNLILALVVVDLSVAAALAWRTHSYVSGSVADSMAATIVVLFAWLPIWFLAARAAHVYDPAAASSGRSMIPDALVACGVVMIPALLLGTVGEARHTVPVAPLAMCAALAVACIIGARIMVQAFLQAAVTRGYCLDRALIAAETMSTALALAAELESRTGGRLRVAAAIPIPGLPDSPSFAWVEDATRRRAVDRVLLAECGTLSPAGTAFLRQLGQCPVSVSVIPDFSAGDITWQLSTANGELTIIDGAEQALSAAQGVYKRATDVLVAITALAVTAPALLAIALAIKFDSRGPVLFRQNRAGLNGVTFSMWKFRTMFHHLADETSTKQTCRDDHRVTRVGRLLRKTSLDELPQLANVLWGDMSIVGPRPHALGMTVANQDVCALIGHYRERYRVKPGITGWAQVNGCRGELNDVRKLRRRVALDCYYIENWSAQMDVRIMLRTLALLLVDRHAY